MYVRNVKQLVRSADPTFDERKYGFSGFNELLRAGAKDGLLRLERGRQGVLRVLPGATLQSALAEAAAAPAGGPEESGTGAAPEPADTVAGAPKIPADAAVTEPAVESEPPKKRRRTRSASGRKSATGGKKPAVRSSRAKKATASVPVE